MTVNMNSTGMSDLVQIISEQGMAGLGGAFQVLLNQAMLIESTLATACHTSLNNFMHI